MAGPDMDNPPTALSAFLVPYDVRPTTAVPLLGMFNGIIMYLGKLIDR